MDTADELRAAFLANPLLVQEWANIVHSAAFRAVTDILLRSAQQRAAGGSFNETEALTARRAIRFGAEAAMLRDLAKVHRTEGKTMGPDLQPWEHIESN